MTTMTTTANTTTTATHIIDANGRRGVITERRDRGVFARPEGMPDSVAFRGGRLSTATFWHAEADGTLRGIWVDSPRGQFVTAYIA